MRRIALAPLSAMALLFLCGQAGAEPTRTASARVLTLKLPFAVARLAVVECSGISSAVLEAADGTRHRVRVATGLLAVEQLTGCAQPDPPARPGTMEDGIVTQGSGAIASAWLAVPTLKYRHGVLGDVVEAQELRAINRNGDTLRYRLDDGSVFEDRLARMVYLNGKDGLLVVRTRLERGAALALFMLQDGAGPAQRLVLAAESAPLGRPDRWLNPIGAADFDGDGTTEIAAVVTPHNSGTLVVYRQEGSRLAEKYQVPGFSNHQIYSRELGMSAIQDFNGDGIPDLLVPDGKRESLRVVTFARGGFRQLLRTQPAAPIVSAIGVADLHGNGKLSAVWVTEDNTLTALVR
jgi:hypothetical protein